MGKFPLGVADNDRVAFDDATQLWQRGSDDGGNEIQFAADTVQDLELLTTADDVVVGSIGLVRATGNLYRATAATAADSSWEPAADVWDVRDFGADPASASNETAINAAIVAASSVARGRVHLSGLFPVTGVVTALNGISIHGDGFAVSGITGNLASGLLVDGGVPVRNTDFYGFQLDNTDRATAGGMGVNFTAAGSRNVFDQVRVFNAETGFRISSGTLHSFDACHATTVDMGFQIVALANETVLKACVVNDVGTRAYDLDSVSNCAFYSCSVQGLTAGFGYHLNICNFTAIYSPRIENSAPTGQVGIRINDAASGSTFIVKPFIQNVTTDIEDVGVNTSVMLTDRFGFGANPDDADANRDNGSFGTLSTVLGGVTLWASSQAGMRIGENDGAGVVVDDDAGDWWFNIANNSWNVGIRGVDLFLFRDNTTNQWFGPQGVATDVGQLGVTSLRWGKAWVNGIAFRVEVDAATITLDEKTCVEVDSSGGVRTIDLPALTSVNTEGRFYMVNLIAGGNAANLTPDAGDNINGAGAGVAKNLNTTGAGLYLVWSSGDAATWHAFGPVAAI